MRNNSLVFTPLLPQGSHLQTKSDVTDLFLDTFSFNGHGTVSQVLWAAIPTLTLPKQRLGQRIGAALVAHSAAPELIARTEAEYVALAQACATRRGRARVRQMRQRLQRSHLSSGSLARFQSQRLSSRLNQKSSFPLQSCSGISIPTPNNMQPRR